MEHVELKAFFQKIENKLNVAYESNDVQKISELLSDNWSILESSTGLSNKNQFLKAIESGRLYQTKMKKEVQKVNLFDNFAIVISKGKNVGQYLEAPYDVDQWVTNIYLKREDGNWICIMTQEVPVTHKIHKSD